MIKRTYSKGCGWCGATGQVAPLYHMTSNMKETCPVCRGAKVVQVVEEDYTEVTFHLDGDILRSVLSRSEI